MLSKIKRKLSSALTLKSHWFIAFITLYFGFVLNLSFWRFVLTHIEITNMSVGIFVISLPFFILAPLYVFFNLITAPYIGKPIIILLLLISSATNYLMFSYGVYIDTDMIRNVFETNTREALDLVTFSGFIWVLITGIIPAVLIAYTKIIYQKPRFEILKRLICIVITVLIIAGFAASSYKEYASFGRNNKDVRKLLNTINYNYSTFRYFQHQIQANRPFVKIDEGAQLMPYEDPHKTVLVFVVGETARSKNFSLYGYERETNPLLAQQDIISFHNTASCGTATAVSLPCMFSHENRDDFDVTDAKYTQNLLDILAKGGYDIIWKDNDDGCKGVCARVKSENMVDTKNKKYCTGTYCHDGILLEGLEDQLRNIKQDTLIVLHTMGSHGPTYYNRYPDEFKKFTPTCDTADIQNCSREAIVNTYDNTILYTDYIVSSVIDIVKKFPELEAGVLYVSDHGESLGENNVYLHGLPYNLAPAEQKEVPFILWMSETMKKYDHVDYDCMKQAALTSDYTHDHLFHSITGLLEVDTPLYKRELDVFKDCRTKALPF